MMGIRKFVPRNSVVFRNLDEAAHREGQVGMQATDKGDGDREVGDQKDTQRDPPARRRHDERRVAAEAPAFTHPQQEQHAKTGHGHHPTHRRAGHGEELPRQGERAKHLPLHGHYMPKPPGGHDLLEGEESRRAGQLQASWGLLQTLQQGRELTGDNLLPVAVQARTSRSRRAEGLFDAARPEERRAVPAEWVRGRAFRRTGSRYVRILPRQTTKACDLRPVEAEM